MASWLTCRGHIESHVKIPLGEAMRGGRNYTTESRGAEHSAWGHPHYGAIHGNEEVTLGVPASSQYCSTDKLSPCALSKFLTHRMVVC